MYLTAEWNWGTIFGSYLVSFLGAGTSMQVLKQRTSNRGQRNFLLLLLSSVALAAVGIFSMHFIGMVAIKHRDSSGFIVDKSYSAGLTVLSLFLATMGVFSAFWLCSQNNHTRWWRVFIGGLLAAAGVCSMHYTGMAAETLNASMRYESTFVIVGVFIAAIASTAALCIIFVWERYWKHDIRILLVASVIMATAVCAMHYTSMLAAVYTELPANSVNISGGASERTMLVITITLSVVSCFGVIIFFLFRYRILLASERAKSNSLLLSALIINNRGQILTTAANTLPSVVIAPVYNGSSEFSQTNKDFLRLMKASFNWSQLYSYLGHLQKSQNGGSVDEYTVKLFRQFIGASEQMARMLNCTISQLGIMYWKPLQTTCILVINANMINQERLEASEFKFQAKIAIQEWVRGQASTNNSRDSTPPTSARSRFPQIFRNNSIIPLHTRANSRTLIMTSSPMLSVTGTSNKPDQISAIDWIDSVVLYSRCVHLPISGHELTEKLNVFLKEIVEDLLNVRDPNLLDLKVKELRNNLGEFVNTVNHLKQLIEYPEEWRDLKLDPMIKVKLRQRIARPTLTSSSSSTAVNSIEDTLTHSYYLGLYSVRVLNNNSLQILIPHPGPCSFLPMVKMNPSVIFKPSLLNTLKTLATQSSYKRYTLTKVKIQLLAQLEKLKTQEPFIPPAEDSPLSNEFLDFLDQLIHSTDELLTFLGPAISWRNFTLAAMAQAHVITMNPDINVLVFVNCAMVDRNSPTVQGNFLYVPLPIFEIVSYNQTIPVRECHGWIRKILNTQLNSQAVANQMNNNTPQQQSNQPSYDLKDALDEMGPEDWEPGTDISISPNLKNRAERASFIDNSEGEEKGEISQPPPSTVIITIDPVQ